MKLQNSRLLFSLLVLLTCCNMLAQDWRAFNEKDKAINEAERKGDYASAVILCNELIEMNINSPNENDSRISIKGHAYFRLGHYYLHAHHYSYDLKKAIYNFEKAVDYNYDHARAEMYLAMIYNLDAYGVKDLNKSLEWIVKGAKRCATMEYILGEIYEYGYTNFLIDDTVHTDKKGHRSIRSNVKLKYKTILRFPNVNKNTKKAYEHYYRYYERNSCYVEPLKISRYDIGVALMDGSYLEKDYSKAFEYLKIFIPSLSELSSDLSSCCNPKSADALWRLSVLYRYGLGTVDNEDRANLYLSYAAKCGCEKAIEAIKSQSHIN